MIILSGLRAILTILSMIGIMLKYSIVGIFKKHNAESAFKLRRDWLKHCGYPILNLKVEVENIPKEKGALYVCNHRSFVDPMVVCNYLDAYVIAKAEVADYPVINKGADMTGVLYVKRENKDSRTAVRDLMIATIQSGKNVLVFPEGTVGVNEKTLPFKTGTFHEAAEHGLAVVPIALEYKSEKDLWMEPNFVFQFLKQFTKWRTEVKVSFGPTLRSNDSEELKNLAYNWINAKLTVHRKDWSEIDFSKYNHIEPTYKPQKVNPIQ
jgi:1-acyl-sn-glycerol-3-phosphate acyltransferase